jgi:nucleotide-binding universal stress UspA family protein
MNVSQAPIVVGVSGSEASAAALRWAADEARRRHAALRVVRSWDAEFTAPYAAADGRLTPGQQRAAASEELTALIRTSFGSVFPAGVTAELAEGAAERTLVDRSAGADLLVLGSASSAAPIGRSIGPVVRACLSRAQCPVVVVWAAPARSPRGDRAGDPDSSHSGFPRSGAARPGLVPAPRQAR